MERTSTVYVMWSLAYEIIFYMMVSALFLFGLNRRSVPISLALSGAALLMVAAPEWHIGQLLGTTGTAAILVGLLVTGVAECVSGNRVATRCGGTLFGVMAVVLASSTGASPVGPIPAWRGLFMLSMMFLGTAVYRVHVGRATVRQVWSAFSAVLVMAATASAYAVSRAGGGSPFRSLEFRHFVLAMFLAFAIFGFGVALRGCAVPGPLVWFGKISFSVYLIHPVLLFLLSDPMNRFATEHHLTSLWQRLFVFLWFVALLALVATLSHHLIERPGQRLGRLCCGRLARAS